MTVLFFTEALDFPEFAFLDGGLDRFAAEFVFENLGAIQPMLDVISLDQDP